MDVTLGSYISSSRHNPSLPFGDKYVPFRTTSVRTDDDAVVPPVDAGLDVRYHQRLRKEVVYRYVEESLYLARMQIHRNDVVTSRDGQHVGDKLGGNGRTRLVLLVHTSVRKTGDHGSDATGRGGFAGRNEDEEFHQVVVDIARPRLDDEHVLFANGFGYFDVDLAI